MKQEIFNKSNPNPFAFAHVNREAYEIAGTVEHRPVACATLSRLVAGSGQRARSYTTNTNRRIDIGPNETWCSIDTIIEDYKSGTGCIASRQNVRTALKWLQRNGIISDRRTALPGTGRFGSIFRLSPQSLKRTEDMVNVLQNHRLFTFGPIKDYRFSGRKVEYEPGSFRKQLFVDNKEWVRSIERNGFENAAYRSVGQWRYAEAGNHDAPVFIPWLVVDIDRGSFPEAYEATLTAIGDLEYAGFDDRSMFVAFSGSKGFHILLSTARMGFPIFRNSRDATEIIKWLLGRWTNVEYDSAVCNPLQVYRISGSRNLKSGLYKTTYDLTKFGSVGLDQIIEDAKAPGGWKYPPLLMEVEEEMVEEMRNAGNYILKNRIGEKEKRSKGYNTIGNGLQAILNGVDEGENFDKHHEGRNKAAFILSCFMVEHPEQLRQVRAELGLDTSFDEYTDNLAYETLEFWYETRATKGTHGVKLRDPFNSALRTINKGRYGRT